MANPKINIFERIDRQSDRSRILNFMDGNTNNDFPTIGGRFLKTNELVFAFRNIHAYDENGQLELQYTRVTASANINLFTPVQGTPTDHKNSIENGFTRCAGPFNTLNREFTKLNLILQQIRQQISQVNELGPGLIWTTRCVLKDVCIALDDDEETVNNSELLIKLAEKHSVCKECKTVSEFPYVS
ncbi:hypothetical protein RRF57_007729 [Xylaria bambusicola]|uniref:Uncharacterized protein n=1 Tax=Xylaria bambusicola TaxID=326684 RepID=A0AAN7Z020_9PEZI